MKVFTYTMLKRRWTSIFFGAVFLTCSPAFGVEVAGISLEDDIRLGDQALILNGAGPRTIGSTAAIAIGVYLTKKRNTPAEIFALEGAKRISLTFLIDLGGERLALAFLKGLKENNDKMERSNFIDSLQAFGAMFSQISEIHKRDQLTLDWVPGSGTVVRINGKRLAANLPNPSFYEALLKLWLGEHPVDPMLKPLLLGNK
jgi:hypothetical protein